MEPDQQSTAERDNNNETIQQSAIADAAVAEIEQNKCEEKKSENNIVINSNNNSKNEQVVKEENVANEKNIQTTETKVDDEISIRHDKKDDTDVVPPQDVQLNSTVTNKSELENKTVTCSEASSEKKNEASNNNNNSTTSCTNSNNIEKIDHVNRNNTDEHINNNNKLSDEKKSVEIENKNNNDSKTTNSNYIAGGFPGGMKAGGSSDSDGKIKIDSLLDRVILYSLKNNVVDNSRLDAAKNKYIKNNGNLSASFNSNKINSNNISNNNTNSNGSDSNSTSKSVDKLIEEFKGSCKANSGNASSTTTTTAISNEQPKNIINNNDNKEISNGADNKSIDHSLEPVNNKRSENEKTTTVVDENKDSPKSLISVDNNSPTQSSQSVTDHKRNSPNVSVTQQNEGLDFRDSSSSNVGEKPAPTMLDLTVKRDEKSVPPIKRSHALYVGLPDFSKQIFTAPSITRTTNTVTNQAMKQPQSLSISTAGPPKVKNPDFTSVNRASELQMRHPDFSRGFASSESKSPINVPITPSNFPEIVRKNNYVSDLQLKPPSNAPNAPSTSYKIDFRPPAMLERKISEEQQIEQESSGSYSKSPYHSSKKESVYNQQLVDEPMAHIIHKNQFQATTKDSINHNWNEHRDERLLGGSSQYEITQEKKMPGTSQSFPSNDDLRKLHPANYQYAYKDRETQLQHQSNEFSLKQKEQQLRQEGTTITIKNESNVKTPTHEIHERRSADLFRDYKLKQPKESPDMVRRVNEPPPLTYHQQYPDFPPNYLRSTKQETVNVKINPSSPVPPQLNHAPHEYSPVMSHYKTPSPIPPHRQQKSPAAGMIPSGSSPMHPPQNWPPVPSQSSRHSISPASISQSPTYMYPHPGPSKQSISPSQSPISHYPYHTSPKLNPQMFKQPESTSTRPMETKSSRPQAPSVNSNQNYYHQKYPDFARKFESDRSNAMYYEQNPNKNHSSFTPIDTKPITIDVSHQNLPIRQDLEIRTVRDPSQSSSQYRYPSSSSNYIPPHEQRHHHNNQQMPPENVAIRQPEIRPHYSRIEHPNEASIMLPDLKIEKRISETPKVYSPVPTRRQETVAELSIIPKIKTEPPSTPAPSTSSIIKSTKTIFAEVKRESPLDLSVKTIKTKADSTGCDSDFRNRKESKLGLKVEFTPNFSNIAKTECRQQARLGPQDYNVERSTISEVPVTYIKEQLPNKVAEPQVAASNPRNHFYDYKQQQLGQEIDRPHAPVPTVSNYYPERHKPNNLYEANRPPNVPIPQPETLNRSYENMRVDPSYQQKNYPLSQQRNNNYHSPQPQANIPYPVISKTTPVAPEQRVPSHPISSKDPLYLERERDRKYVESLLYGRNSRKELEQKPYTTEHRQFQPTTSPPRKRHLEMAGQHVYENLPPKQGRIEEPHRLYNSNIPQHPYERRIEPNMNPCPPVLACRPEAYPKIVSNSNDAIPKHYPSPKRDVIKSAEMMSYSNPSPPVHYYPNPKAEMIQRSDPNMSQKYYMRESERNYYHPNQLSKQNFHQRPDDATYPTHNSRISHPVQDMSIKVEQLNTAGPVQENQGEQHRHMNSLIMPTSVSGSNGNIARGAEQSTIQKLKSNLELKEMQKLKKTEMNEEMNEHIKHMNSQKQQQQQQQHLMKVDLSPRQFRTKGELKGFTPLPTSIDVNKTNVEMPNVGTSGFDLLDWGSACNDFVQQLQTGSRKRYKKKRPLSASKSFMKTDDNKMMSKLPGTTSNDLSKVPKEFLQSIKEKEMYSSSDEDKPLVAIKKSITDNVPEKLSRNFREKQRQNVEQKFAARLGRPSSSESETDTRKSVNSVKRVRRLRKREHLGIKKTDDEHSAEIYDDDVHQKGKNLVKVDDLTSSDEEKKRSLGDDDKKSSPTGVLASATEDNSKSTKKSVTDVSKASNSQTKSSSESSGSSSEEETTEDKINKLSTAKNVKRLKDLGDSSNFKNLLREGETMTRSKRKLEIEKKLSNSKILRNDKVVQNVTRDKKLKMEPVAAATCPNNKKSPLKRKDSCKSEDSKRKMHESETEKESSSAGKKKHRKSSRVGEKSSSEASENEDEDEEEEEEVENKTERLRPRKVKTENEIATKATKEPAKKKVQQKEKVESNLKASDYKEGRRSLSALYPFKDDKTSKFTTGWEAETYNFKLSLNVPPGLITIGRPPQHGISHSLPDLDPQTSDTSEIFSEFIKSKDRDAGKDVKGETSKAKKVPVTQKPEIKKRPNSIIDLLHQRVVQTSNRKIKPAKKATVAASSTPIAKPSKNEDLLPTPEKESEKVFGMKKNIFEPFIITSRTRTENNAYRKKEILKEVFGADDERPRSAPPSAEITEGEQQPPNDEATTEKKISYDQKYLEYLEKMNVDFPERKSYLSKLNSIKTEVKEEEEDFDDNETVGASERDLVTPTIKGKVKKNRPRRLKGSSGFDYIRKKKKPTPNASENPLNVNAIIKKRLAAMENQETKDENDISKEIKGWVLNKGVGESVLHKASRLNYVDVVAYCLDRLGMNPDSKDNAGYTPLHEACSRGHLEIARLLLQYGANHSEAALSGIRPLHEAIENGHIEIVRLLLSFGADPCLATYSGQMPIAMAEDKEMEDFLHAYLIDIDNKEGTKKSWFTDGAFKIEDPDEIGYDIYSNVPIVKTDLGSSVASILSTSMTSLITATTQLSDNETVISETATTLPSKILATPMKAPTQDLIKYQHKMKKCDTNSNNLVISDANDNNKSITTTPASKKTKNCSVLLNNIDSTMKKIKKLPSISKFDSHSIKTNCEGIHKIEEIHSHKEDYDDMIIDENMESDCEFLELEESEAPLPPLYLLRGEGSDKWILLADLCNLLKVKSKEAVLKQICPSSPPSANKELIRELKMSEFLEKAICLQLFCAGEKINIRASKVSLVRYNESVKNLLGVQTIRMNM